jgi:Kef-type K+ transport system membrane component KefB
VLEGSLSDLVLIAAAAVAAPILSERLRRFRVPSVVLELALGILIGPYVLGLVKPTSLVTSLSDMGLSFLMFLAGFELDLGRIKGRPLGLASAGWLMSLVLGLGFAFAMVSTGLAIDTVIIGLALTTTALGTLLPIMKDAGLLSSPFGTYVIGIGTAGEFGPIVGVAIFLTGKNPGASLGLLAVFVAVAVTAAVAATRAHPPRVVSFLGRHLNSSAQLPVRVSMLLVLALIYVAYELGLDILLGAFAAGIVFRLFNTGENRAAVESKLQAIGFGFLIPIFFVTSGVNFDLHILVHEPSTLARLGLFLVLFLVVRGVPALTLYRKALPVAERLPLAVLSATGLPLIVVITTIGAQEGRIRPENAAALVGAGVVSVLLFPSIALGRLGALRRGSPKQPEGAIDDASDDSL